ncbi:MAG: HAMP domain-containing sensor histidine kinase [Candidatus Promineifilaceae bacterium]|nr:HAMP domain-containing sensor histidine kinase [Candidatus Promineifilaceae bacterium]
MKWRWALLPVPLALSLLLALILNEGLLPNPLLRIRVSISTLLIFLGAALSGGLATVFLLWHFAERRLVEQRQQIQSQVADDRRRFLRRLDHELKNPLMAMRAGLANFANAPSAETRREALHTVEVQTVRLSRLTSDLRKIAELESRPLERAAVQLDLLLQEAIDLVTERPEATERQVKLVLPQAPWPLPTITGDWDLIFLAVYNLLDNAVKFSRSGDTIEVRGREEGQMVILEIADTGPGIEASELPHVWEELYRGDRGRTVPGSGLGLALVKAVAERHGGNVALTSKAGQGTIFALKLPVDAH